MVSPIAVQILVAGSTHLAALTAGGVIAYPSTLLQQLRSNDTSINIDLENGSWIGSVHGIAGIPSILLPLFMQYKGRKLAFILSCLFVIIGWGFAVTAKSVSTIIIGESFHGLGGNSLLAVSFLSVSEMVKPKYRNTCLSLYGTIQALGISIVGIFGRYLHWKTVGLIMCAPILIAVPIGCGWPESPSWLALKGRLDECQRSFKKLRVMDEESRKELKALMRAQRESKSQERLFTKKWFMDFLGTITRRDFYVPALHNMLVLNVSYWGGGMPVIIYSTDMILKSSGKPNTEVKFFMDVALFVGYCISSLLVRFYSSKKILLLSMAGSVIFMTTASVGTFLQSATILPRDSEFAVYCLAGFVAFMSLGSTSLGYCLASELMPVKHRGIGGSLFVICTCVFHSSSLKAYPYLCLYIDISGVYLLYAVYKILSIILIWKYVPDTKNRTLQELEEYYVYGHFRENAEDQTLSSQSVNRKPYSKVFQFLNVRSHTDSDSRY